MKRLIIAAAILTGVDLLIEHYCRWEGLVMPVGGGPCFSVWRLPVVGYLGERASNYFESVLVLLEIDTFLLWLAVAAFALWALFMKVSRVLIPDPC